MKKSLMFFVFVLIALTGNAEPKVTVQLRDMGYTLGDDIDASVHIQLDKGDSLDPDSLPLPGPLNAWLDLKNIRLAQHGDAYHMHLRWQIFRTVESAQKVSLPVIALKTMQQPARVVEIPAQVVFVSPVLANPIQDANPRGMMAPQHLDVKFKALRTLALFILSIGLLLVWLWLIDRLPGFPRSPKPMTLLARYLKAKRWKLTKADMQKVHSALNEIAGETLYPTTLARLFDRAPYLTSFRSDIEQFFDASWQTFFQSAEDVPDLACVQSWVEQCARAERLTRAPRNFKG